MVAKLSGSAGLRFAFLTAMASFSIACGSAAGVREETPHVVQLPGTPVEVVEIRVNPAPQTPLTWYSGYSSPQRLVIRSPVEWAGAWATMFGREFPQPPLPDVDFAREMVIVAGAGIRATAGYGITIPNAAQDEATLYVGVIESRPRSDCGVAAVLTSPVYAVRMARLDGDPVFVDGSIVVACGR